MNYDEMPAGAEMDRLVAEKVMGWTLDTEPAVALARRGLEQWWRKKDGYGKSVKCWLPSVNITQAWEVVAKLSEMKYPLDIISTDSGWMVGSGGMGYADDAGRVDLILQNPATADTAPLAICRAALKAVGAK